MKFRWHVGRERVKTVILVVLVGMSVILSTFIWTGTLTEVVVSNTGFYSNPLYGSKRSVTEFIKPTAIWLWTSNKELFRINGNSSIAQTILHELQEGRLLSYQIVGRKSQVVTVPNKSPSLVIDYNGLLQDASLWRLALPISGMPMIFPTRQGIKLTPVGRDNQYDMVFTVGRGKFVGKLQLPDKFQRWLEPVKQEVPFAQIPVNASEMLLPYAALNMNVLRWTLQSPVATHVIDSFFVDPSLVQSIPNNPHEILYTDGTVNVLLGTGDLGDQLIYEYPSGQVQGFRESVYSALHEAVPFMDSHGGFAGNQELTSAVHTESGVQLTFQDSVNGWPLFSQLDQIQMQVRNGIVIGLQHWLSYPRYTEPIKKIRVLSGMQLVSALTKEQLQGLQGISLGYGVEPQDTQTVLLIPVYRLFYAKKPPVDLNAQTGKPLTGGI